MSAQAADPFDCRRCGACCRPGDDRAGYVELTPADIRRLSRTPESAALVPPAATKLPTTCTRRDGTVCVALRGAIGRNVWCSIYEQRPRACRIFRPGSRICRIVRALAFDGEDG